MMMAEDIESTKIIKRGGTSNDDVIMDDVTNDNSTSSYSNIDADFVVTSVDREPPDVLCTLSGTNSPGPLLSLSHVTDSHSVQRQTAIVNTHKPECKCVELRSQFESCLDVRISKSDCIVRISGASSSDNQTVDHQCDSGSHSDGESEIIVDDSPAAIDNNVEMVTISASSDRSDKGTHNELTGDADHAFLSVTLGRSRSVTPSPLYINLATPSTPGTPRLRSGSVSGTAFAALSPRPLTRGTPGERARAGSMGEIDMRIKDHGHGVRIIDGLDILQLPRPRNPGGILPQNGGPIRTPVSSIPVNLNNNFQIIFDNLHSVKRKNGDSQSSESLFSSLASSSTLSNSKPNTSYLISNIIRTTPNRNKSVANAVRQQNGCAINESIERPKPNSVVDSEGVAKKIARIDNEGFIVTHSVGNLWNRNESGQPSMDRMSGIRLTSEKTPPERPKPPPRAVLSPTDNGSMEILSGRHVSSSVKRRFSPSRQHIPVTYGVKRRFSPSRQHIPVTYGLADSGSPDDVCKLPQNFQCKLCNYSAATSTLLQIHTTTHAVTSKTLRCSACDYTTSEKSNLRRHRRLHHKSSPVNPLKCRKCSYMTSMSRKLRDHCQQSHPEMPSSPLMQGLTSGPVSPLRIIEPEDISVDGGAGMYPEGSAPSVYPPGHYYNNAILMNRLDRYGYPYHLTGRQPPMSLSLDQYNIPYHASYSDRQGENLASNYLRSIVTSIMNSESSSRQAATSTVTSSNYFLPTTTDNSHVIQDVHTCTNQGPFPHSNCRSDHSSVLIKTEHYIDNASDITSTAANTKNLIENHKSVLNDVLETSHRTQSCKQSRCDNSSASRNSSYDFPTDLSFRRSDHPLSEFAAIFGNTSRAVIENDNGSDTVTLSNTVMKTDMTTRGIQCILPVAKTELDFNRSQQRYPCTDQAVQCNLSSNSTMRSRTHSNQTGYRSQSGSESENSEHRSSVCGESRCEFCGINFDDEVLFSIHIGCHSHTEPFKCNVCGKQCGNKYGFYSHIMRGHQF